MLFPAGCLGHCPTKNLSEAPYSHSGNTRKSKLDRALGILSQGPFGLHQFSIEFDQLLWRQGFTP
jgi:hypothetical protein